MKNLILVFVLASLISCSKELKQSPKNIEMASKKGKGNPQAAASTSSITLTNPAQDSLAWNVPGVVGTEVYVYTYVEWGTDSSGSFQKISGIQIPNGTTTPLTEYKDGITSPYFNIPSGTWSIRVTGYKATPNPVYGPTEPVYITSSWVEYQSNVLTNVTFN